MDLLSIAVFNLLIRPCSLPQQQVWPARQFLHAHGQCFSTNESLAPFLNKKLTLFLKRRLVKNNFQYPQHSFHAPAWTSQTHLLSPRLFQEFLIKRSAARRKQELPYGNLAHILWQRKTNSSNKLFGFLPQPVWGQKRHKNVSYSHDGCSAGQNIYHPLTRLSPLLFPPLEVGHCINFTCLRYFF